MDLLIQLNSQRSGRDKIFRVAQYSLEMLLALRPYANLTLLYRNVARFRKLLRLGTFLDTLYGIRRTLGLSDPVLRLLTTLTRLALTGYLFNDHLVLLSQLDVYPLTDERLTQRRSDQWWLMSIVLALLRNVYDLTASRKEVRLDAVTNFCDLFLPLSYLHIFNPPEWLVGFLGVVSSFTAALPILDPTFKLSPAG